MFDLKLYDALKVECRTEGCPAAGVVKEVPLDIVAVNLVAIPTLRCAVCGAAPYEIWTTGEVT